MRLATLPNSRNDVLISAYSVGVKKVIVVINTGTNDVNQKVSFEGASAASFVPYVTTQSKNVEQGTGLTAANNSFSYKLPPKSITTFVEQ